MMDSSTNWVKLHDSTMFYDEFTMDKRLSG